MRSETRRSLLLGWSIALMPAVTAAATQDHVGSWVISCPGDQPCLMRLDKRFLDKSGVTGDLEIEAEGNTLVPILALRGLSSEVLMAAAMAGKAEASLQFPGGTREVLDCAIAEAGYICAPNETIGSKLAAGLPAARQVTVRVVVAVAGMAPLPAQERSLDLTGTSEALARLRAAGPAPVPNLRSALASKSPAGLMGMADRALKAAGYPNGMADLQARLAKYMRK